MSQTIPKPVDLLDVNEVIADAFPDSRPDTLAALASAARVVTFGPGEMILNQGDDGRLVLVMDGYVGLHRTTIDGRQLTTRIATRGELATVLSLASRPSAADLVALTFARVLIWLPSKARALAERDPGFAMAIIDHILASVETLVERVDGLLYQDAVTRVARVLYAHRDLFFSEPPVLTRSHLPALVGTSREMTSRVLRILETRGMVSRVGRDRLLIVDIDKLEQTAVGPSGLRPRDVRNRYFSTRGKRGAGAVGGHSAISHQQRSADFPAVLPEDGDADKKILLVIEDEPSAREMTKVMVERAGYRVVAVADGRAAIEAIGTEAGAVDVLIADVVMPNVSGLELAESIIERDPRVGLVLLSRYTEATLDLARIRARGAVFVAMPEATGDLFAAVRRPVPASDAD
jgi:CRP-like cAMP-binding protein/CheY-like chemotaxis protein